MANNDKENKIKKFTKEAIGKTLNQFNKEIGIADLVEINKNQDRILNGILSQVNDENTEKTEKSNIITLDNSTDGIVELQEIQGDTNVNVSKIEEMPITHDIGDKEGNVFTLNEIPKGAISIGEIQGNTMVNCNKDDEKELVLMKDLSTQGDNNIVITEGVDGGLVDIALEGNTMVNVCDQKDPVAITKAYIVENSGNHIALQGDVDGSCRPVITGNTLWIDNATEEVLTAFDETKNLRLQSTFEDNLVTQEMVDSREEIADNLGKYRVDYKSTQEDGTVGSTKTLYLNSPLLEGDTIEEKDGSIYHVHRGELTAYTEGDETSLITDKVNTLHGLETPTYELIEQSNLTIPSYANGHLDLSSAVPVSKVNFLHFEEELTYLYPSTSYTVQFMSDKAITADITLGGTQLLAQNIVKGLNKISITTPETLANNKLVIDGLGARISEVVVTDTDREFKYFEGMKSVGECEELEVKSSTNKNLFDVNAYPFINGFTYNYATGDKMFKTSTTTADMIPIKPNTVYSYNCFIENKTIIGEVALYYFDKDKKYIRRDVEVRDDSRYNIITPDNAKYVSITLMSNNDTYLDGSKVTLVYGNTIPDSYIPHQSNVQQLTHEPLRAVGEVKDKYVLIDGKWYIERNCWEYTIPQDTIWTKTNMVSNNGKYTRYYFIMDNMITDQLNASNYENFAISELLPFGYSNSWTSCNRNEIQIINDSTELYVQLDKTAIEEVASLMNGSKIIYRLKKPVYEELDYNPLEVYEDVTHITTNSTIPTNITIKNHGFNCLLKPNTTYTVSSNLGINTVTTRADIGDSCLRFYDEDTSDVTTMKDVLILEGDWTTKANLIPSNFSGIESAFEQELVTDEADEHYGKYKVNAKVVGKNVFNKNIEFLDGYYISDEDGTNTRLDGYCVSKDYIRIQPNTTYYGANMNHIALYDKDKNYIRRHALWDSEKTFTTSSNAYYLRYQFSVNDDFNRVQLEQGDTATEYEPYKENNITFYINEPLRGIGDVKDKVYVKNDRVVVERNCGSVVFDGSEDENFVTYTDGVNTRAFGIINTAISLKYMRICLSNNFIGYGDSLAGANKNDRETIVVGGSVAPIVIYINKNKMISNDIVGFKQWLQQNPTTVVYKLAEPIYEEVEYSSNRLILDTFNNESFNNSTLFLDTNISPKLSFKPLWEELVYVKSNTKYYIQFNAVGSGEVVINLGGTELTTEIVEGYNCIPITTPSESTNLMTISGQGITISEVVVSEVVCGGYYKGLQSCFEEHMENGKYRILLRGIALDGSKVNGIKLYINEPLRGVGGIKDRLCIKDGKLMVERRCGEEIFDGSDDENWKFHKLEISGKYAYISNKSLGKYKKNEDIISNVKSVNWIENPWTITDNIISFLGSIGAIYSYTDYNNLNDFKSNLNSNPMIVVYPKDTIIYEEATNEYGLPIVFEGYENGVVYIDSAITPTTHIKYTSNNQLATTLSEAEEQNNSTQDDINVNVVTYMMDIDMLLTEMEMSNDISVMAVRRDSSNENMLDRMSEEDKKVYRDNTVVMLEKMITAQALEKEDIERRINMYYDKNRISKEQYKYLKSLL